MQLQNVVDKFILDKKVYCAPKTIETYTEHLNRFVLHAPDQLEKLTRETIRKYILDMRDEGIRNVTIQTYMRTVKVFCRWLYEEGYIDEPIADGMKLPRPDPKPKKPLTEKEALIVDSFLISTRDRIIFHLMLDAGLRESEVCNLRREDIDFQNRFILIRNSKYNRNRVVPLCSRLYNWTKFYHSTGDYLLTTPSGDRLSENLIKQLFQRLKKQTGIERIHAHLCRHTFATSYIMGGGNLEKLRLMLGHEDYNTTKVYLHLAAEFEIVRYPIYQLDPVFFERGY